MCSTNFTCKTILSLKNFIKIHSNLLKDEKFLDIIKSINKFIFSKSLLIQLNAIKLFFYLIDSKWSFDDQIIPEEYFNFCNEMYNNLNMFTEKVSKIF